MGTFDWLSGIGAENEQNAMGVNYNQITNSIAPGSGYYVTDATGDTATALQQQAAALKAQKVQANWAAANASGDQLTAIGNQAAQMGLNGGRQGQAAIDAAQAQVANAGGGLGGLRQIGAVGAQAGANAANIAQQESTNFLNQASQAKSAVSGAKLQQLVVNAALNHANAQNALAAQGISYGVTNLQNTTATQLNTAAMKAARSRDATQIQASNAQDAAALAYATAITSAAAKGAGAIASSTSDDNDDGTSATSAYTPNSLGTPALTTDPSLGITATPDYSTASLTDPTANGLNFTSAATPTTQATLDQSLFSTPSNIFGVY